MNQLQLIQQLQGTAQWINKKGWCPATGGNFSARLDSEHFLITASGKDKGQLEETDFLLAALNGEIIKTNVSASAEMPVHSYLYQKYPETGAVLHTHSVNATVFSRIATKEIWQITGYEMLKSIEGFSTHNETLSLPILDNSQDMSALVKSLTELQRHQALPNGFLVRGHGLYTWGKDLFTARRHLEGLEFLISCELAHIQLQR